MAAKREIWHTTIKRRVKIIGHSLRHSRTLAMLEEMTEGKNRKEQQRINYKEHRMKNTWYKVFFLRLKDLRKVVKQR